SVIVLASALSSPSVKPCERKAGTVV
ncbi:hypothetical protein MA13_contig00035-0002, partial [Edwardsiella piscicida]